MVGKQLGFSNYETTTAKKPTKREKFLSEMEAVVPWQALIDLIKPHTPKRARKAGGPNIRISNTANSNELYGFELMNTQYNRLAQNKGSNNGSGLYG